MIFVKSIVTQFVNETYITQTYTVYPAKVLPRYTHAYVHMCARVCTYARR